MLSYPSDSNWDWSLGWVASMASNAMSFDIRRLDREQFEVFGVTIFLIPHLTSGALSAFNYLSQI